MLGIVSSELFRHIRICSDTGFAVNRNNHFNKHVSFDFQSFYFIQHPVYSPYLYHTKRSEVNKISLWPPLIRIHPITSLANLHVSTYPLFTVYTPAPVSGDVYLIPPPVEYSVCLAFHYHVSIYLCQSQVLHSDSVLEL